MKRYALGIDYGTNSCRSLLIDLDNGAEAGSTVFNYPSGYVTINNLKANGVTSIDLDSPMIKTKTRNVLSYYVVDNSPLELEFYIDFTDSLDMNLVESSFDLMTNPLLKITPRDATMIPKPFILNNAIIVKQKLKPTPKPVLLPKSVFKKTYNKTQTF